VASLASHLSRHAGANRRVAATAPGSESSADSNPLAISPSRVGYDIGCGNKAVRTDLLGGELLPDLGGVMDTICDRVSFGVGRGNDEPVDHPVLDRIREADFASYVVPAPRSWTKVHWTVGPSGWCHAAQATTAGS
jgi:hypothetical protein